MGKGNGAVFKRLIKIVSFKNILQRYVTYNVSFPMHRLNPLPDFLPYEVAGWLGTAPNEMEVSSSNPSLPPTLWHKTYKKIFSGSFNCCVVIMTLNFVFKTSCFACH